MTAKDILQAARRRGWRIATAESCTGGMVSAALTDLPGSSDVFDRGFVTYSNAQNAICWGCWPKRWHSMARYPNPLRAKWRRARGCGPGLIWRCRSRHRGARRVRVQTRRARLLWSSTPKPVAAREAT
jgi:hypothetical protein